MNAGDTVALCRGGAWDESGGGFANANCTAEAPCDFRDYLPAWADAAAPRPRLNLGNSCGFSSQSPATHGARFWNLELRLPLNPEAGCNDVYGFQLWSLVTDLDICNVRVDGGRSSVDLGIADAAVDTHAWSPADPGVERSAPIDVGAMQH